MFIFSRLENFGFLGFPMGFCWAYLCFRFWLRFLHLSYRFLQCLFSFTSASRSKARSCGRGWRSAVRRVGGELAEFGQICNENRESLLTQGFGTMGEHLAQVDFLSHSQVSFEVGFLLQLHSASEKSRLFPFAHRECTRIWICANTHTCAYPCIYVGMSARWQSRLDILRHLIQLICASR